jgi:hypothetical protein
MRSFFPRMRLAAAYPEGASRMRAVAEHTRMESDPSVRMSRGADVRFNAAACRPGITFIRRYMAKEGL